MTKIIKIEKLKDDLSNAISSVNLLQEEVVRSSANTYEQEQLIPRREQAEERQRLIEKGYSKIVDNVYYTTYPSEFQKYAFKERFDVEFVE